MPGSRLSGSRLCGRCGTTTVQPAAWRAVLLTALALPACSHTAPSQELPTVGPDPAYAKLIAAHLQTTFKNLTPNDGLEISPPRWVQSNKGWSWLACVHFQDRGHRRTYAVFFNNSEVVDGRYAVETDDCGTQTYSPFNLTTMSPGAVGPLY